MGEIVKVRLFTDPDKSAEIFIPRKCAWESLTSVIAVRLGLRNANSIQYLILCNSENYPLGDVVTDTDTFWSLFWHYRPEEDMAFLVRTDDRIELSPTDNHNSDASGFHTSLASLMASIDNQNQIWSSVGLQGVQEDEEPSFNRMTPSGHRHTDTPPLNETKSSNQHTINHIESSQYKSKAEERTEVQPVEQSYYHHQKQQQLQQRRDDSDDDENFHLEAEEKRKAAEQQALIRLRQMEARNRQRLEESSLLLSKNGSMDSSVIPPPPQQPPTSSFSALETSRPLPTFHEKPHHQRDSTPFDNNSLGSAANHIEPNFYSQISVESKNSVALPVHHSNRLHPYNHTLISESNVHSSTANNHSMNNINNNNYISFNPPESNSQYHSNIASGRSILETVTGGGLAVTGPSTGDTDSSTSTKEPKTFFGIGMKPGIHETSSSSSNNNSNDGKPPRDLNVGITTTTTTPPASLPVSVSSGKETAPVTPITSSNTIQKVIPQSSYSKSAPQPVNVLGTIPPLVPALPSPQSVITNTVNSSLTSSPGSVIEQLKSVRIRLSTNALREAVVEVPVECSWEELTTTFAKALGLFTGASIISMVLLDEDGDETSCALTDDSKFWKFYMRRYIHQDGMLFLIKIDLNIESEVEMEEEKRLAKELEIQRRQAEDKVNEKVRERLRLDELRLKQEEEEEALRQEHIRLANLVAQQQQQVLHAAAQADTTQINPRLNAMLGLNTNLQNQLSSQPQQHYLQQQPQHQLQVSSSSQVPSQLIGSIPVSNGIAVTEFNGVSNGLGTHSSLSAPHLDPSGAAPEAHKPNIESASFSLEQGLEGHLQSTRIGDLAISDISTGNYQNNDTLPLHSEILVNHNTQSSTPPSDVTPPSVPAVQYAHEPTPVALPQTPVKAEKSVLIHGRLGDDVPGSFIQLELVADSSWESIIQSLSDQFHLSTNQIIDKITLVDEDGDDVFGDITSSPRFWKAVNARYRPDTMVFIMHATPRSSSTLGLPPVQSISPIPKSVFGSSQQDLRPTTFQQPPAVPTNGHYVETRWNKSASSSTDGEESAFTYSHPTSFSQPQPQPQFQFGHPQQSQTQQLPSVSIPFNPQPIGHAGPSVFDNNRHTIPLGNAFVTGTATNNHHFSSAPITPQQPKTSSNSPAQAVAPTNKQPLYTPPTYAPATQIDPQQITSFLKSCSEGDIVSAKQQLSSGMDVNTRDQMGLTAMHVVSIVGRLDMAQWLIQQGASYSSRDKEGMTPLHYACDNKHIQLALFLVRTGADSSLRNKAGITSLHIICIRGVMELTQLIRDYMINVATGSGLTLLHCAADQGHENLVKYLITHGAQLQARDDDGMTPLHLASMAGHVEVCRILIDSGAYWNARDDEGMSPLLYACQEGHYELVYLLIDCNANIHARNNAGATALHLACESGCLDIVQLLLDRNADVDVRRKDGLTPLQIAQNASNQELVSFLSDKGIVEPPPEADSDIALRVQVENKAEAAIRAFEAEEEASLQQEIQDQSNLKSSVQR